MFNLKAVFLSGILLLACLAASAQIGFRAGYVIKNNGDTLTGLVFYGIESSFNKGCRFKRFEIVREVKYGPNDLLAFGFRNGRHFESKNTGDRKQFYECLIKGLLSLYCVPGKTNGQLFVDHAATGFIKLNKGINQSADGENFRNHQDFLLHLLSKSGYYTDSVPSPDYNAVSVAALIRASAGNSRIPSKAFNHTPGISFLKDYSITRTKPLWKTGVAWGYQFLKISIPGTSITRYFSEASYNPSYRPVAGVFVNRRLSKKSDLLSIDLAVFYQSEKYYGYAEYKTVSDCRDEIFLEFSAIQIPLSLKLMLKRQHVRPFIKAGTYGSFLIRSSYSRFAERQFGTEIFTDRYTDFKIKNDRGFHGGIGIEIPVGHIRKISIEAMYMQGSQFLIYTDRYSEPLDSKVVSYVFGLMFGVNL